jgi:tetratricopeptide (TPR) repeat protein
LIEPGLAESMRAIGPTVVGSTAFASGRLAEAAAELAKCAEVYWANLPSSISIRAHSALWLGDATGAGHLLDILDGAGLHGPAIEADRVTIRAGIAALEARINDALGLYREALRAWRDLGLAWDEALCAIDMAQLIGPGDPEVREAAAAAREILVRLEAAPFVERLDAAVAAWPPSVQPSAIRTHA